MAPTLIDIDSFAHQTLATSQAGSGFIGMYDTIANSGAFSFDSVVKRLPSHICSLKCIQDGVTAAGLSRTVVAGNRILVFSFYFRVAANPAGTYTICVSAGPTNTPRVAINTSGQLLIRVGTTTLQTSLNSYADGGWHLFDGRFDTSGTTYLIDWQIDGIAQPQGSIAAQVAADMGSFKIGTSTNADALTFWVQDQVLSATSGDFPIGAHECAVIYPSSEGTDVVGTTNAITSSDAAAFWTDVDDWNGGTPSTTDYVTYASTTLGDAASNFAEFVMQASLASSGVWDVRGIIAGFAASTTACTADLQVLTDHGGTLIDHIGNLIDYSGSTSVLGYYQRLLTRPSGGWTKAILDAIVAQWGRSNDTSPLPRLSALMFEYAIPERPIETLGSMPL